MAKKKNIQPGLEKETFGLQKESNSWVTNTLFVGKLLERQKNKKKINMLCKKQRRIDTSYKAFPNILPKNSNNFRWLLWMQDVVDG